MLEKDFLLTIISNNNKYNNYAMKNINGNLSRCVRIK